MAYYCKYYNSAAANELNKRLGTTHDTWIPESDIFETKSEIIALIDLPGVEASDIELTLDNDKLIARGTRKRERPKLIKCYKQLEIRHGQFEKILDLPCKVDLGKATISNGVLEIILPKLSATNNEPITIDID